MEVVHARAVVRHSGYVAQGQIGFAPKIIGRQDIVIHHREAYHGALGEALLKGDGELEALIEDGVKSALGWGINK